jgi:D-ribose pyranase
MLKTGIINPYINSLLSRIRHTNRLVIADRGFPYQPHIEYIDIALIDDIPTVLDVYLALNRNFNIVQIWMAEEFLKPEQDSGRAFAMRRCFERQQIVFEPHIDFKKRASDAIGLIRTGDTIPYSNMIVESG